MYSSRCRYLVTILVIMIHTVSTSLKYYSASSFIWRWYESYDYCETPCSAAPMPSMPAWQVRALCAWPGSAQVYPSPCLRLHFLFFSKRCRFFSVSKSAWNSLRISARGLHSWARDPPASSLRWPPERLDVGWSAPGKAHAATALPTFPKNVK